MRSTSLAAAPLTSLASEGKLIFLPSAKNYTEALDSKTLSGASWGGEELGKIGATGKIQYAAGGV